MKSKVFEQIIKETPKEVSDRVERLVKCPNMCWNGNVPYYPDKTKALFELKPCKYCEGKGEVLKEDYERIDKSI